METHPAQSALSALGRNALLAIECADAATSLGMARSVRDRTLGGLIGKGHRLDAICAFLGLLQVDLLARICALNLSTPHNGSIRRKNGSRNAWQLGEIRQLIELWELNVSSTSIAVRLGRSQGSIRAKARWLGLTRRARRDIIADVPAVITPVDKTSQTASEGKRQRTKWVNAVYEQVIERFLSYQHYKGIALDLELTPAQVRSKIQVLALPSDRERHLQSMDYQPGTPHAAALKARYKIRECPETKQVYVTPSRGRQNYCPAYYKTQQYRHRAAFGHENCSVSGLC